MTDMVIPPEAVEAAAKAMFADEHCDKRQMQDVQGNWDARLNDEDQALYRSMAAAALEAALPHLRPTACTCPTDADITPDMRTETGQHLSGCPFAAEGLGAWMDEQIERIAETKALVETATRLGRELGRREAAEEIAHRCELDATYDTASRYHFSKIAREIATKEPK